MATTNNRWLYFVVGIVLFLFLGLLYAWSLFIKPLEVYFGWNRIDTSLIFTISIIFFCLGGMAGGFITGRKSPGFTLSISAVLLLIGFCASSQVNSLTGFFITYGVISGFAIGLSYNAILSTVTRWFPEKPGAISGFLLMGFGLGAFLLTSIANWLISITGWQHTFILLGIAFGIIVFIGSRILKFPPSDYVFPVPISKAKNSDVECMEINSALMLKRPTFWKYLIWSILCTAVGLTMISQAKVFALELPTTDALATLAVGVISICNGLGRVTLGATCDRIGLKKTMAIVNTTYIIAVIFLIAAVMSKNINLLFVGLIFTGISYGGVPTMNTVFVNSFYGKKFFPQNLGLVNTSLIGAAFIGPSVAGILHTTSVSYLSTLLGPSVVGILHLSSSSYLSTLYVLGIYAIVAGFVIILIKNP